MINKGYVGIIIDEGKTYRIRTQGFRFGFLSDFKKITRIEEIN